MCNGPIVASVGNLRDETESSFSLMEFLKRFWEKISCSAVRLEDQPKVNMCLKCGDLEINGEWLKIPHPQKPRISDEVKSGTITINGRLTVCDFCGFMERKIKKISKIFKGSSAFQLDFVHPTSSMSF